MLETVLTEALSTREPLNEYSHCSRAPRKYLLLLLPLLEKMDFQMDLDLVSKKVPLQSRQDRHQEEETLRR
jgi:hypothetical protein